MIDKFLMTKDLRKILGCSSPKAYAIMHHSGFPSIKIGKQYYVGENEFNKWIARNLYKSVDL